jgi:hypothetical protein
MVESIAPETGNDKIPRHEVQRFIVKFKVIESHNDFRFGIICFRVNFLEIPIQSEDLSPVSSHDYRQKLDTAYL